MKRSALDRLLELRRRREEKSLEALALRQGAHRRAKDEAEEAHNAVVQHALNAADRERALINGLVGQSITKAAIARIQAELDTQAYEQRDLRKVDVAARKLVREHRQELDKARKTYHDRRIDAEKLNELRAKEIAKIARHEIAIDESIEEDQGGLMPRRSQIL